MKKYIALGVCVAVFLVAMVACSWQAEQAPAEQAEPSQEVQQTEPVSIPSEEPSAQVIDVDNRLTNTQGREKQELSGEALIRYFQLTYDCCSIIESNSLDEQINFELEILPTLCDTDGEKLPADYASQYKNWRPAEEQQAQPQAPEIQLFTDCNETVYTTGTVNIRASWTASSTKLGSLSWGQSVTRTGTPIKGTEAEGWSRVTLSDGTTAYISNSYLSTAKPVQQNTNNGGGTTTTSGQTGQTTQPSGGSSTSRPASGDNSDPLWEDPYAGMTPEEKEAAIEAAREAMEREAEGSTGTLHDGGSQSTPSQSDSTGTGGSSGGYDPDTSFWTDPYAGMTPEEKEAAIEAAREATQRAIEGSTGTLHG